MPIKFGHHLSRLKYRFLSWCEEIKIGRKHNKHDKKRPKYCNSKCNNNSKFFFPLYTMVVVLTIGMGVAYKTVERLHERVDVLSVENNKLKDKINDVDSKLTHIDDKLDYILLNQSSLNNNNPQQKPKKENKNNNTNTKQSPVKSNNETMEFKKHNTTKQERVIQCYILKINKNVSENEAKYMAVCFVDAGNAFKLDPYLLTGLAKVESSFNKRAVSKCNAVGLMQVHWPAHHRNLKKAFKTINCREDMFSIRNAIFAGAWIYRCALDEYNNNHALALNRYLSANSAGYREKVLSVKRTLARM